MVRKSLDQYLSVNNLIKIIAFLFIGVILFKLGKLVGELTYYTLN